MQQRKKKIISIDEYLEKQKQPSLEKQRLSEKYHTSIGKARANSEEEEQIDKLKLRTGNYSLKTKIIKNPWVVSRPATKAVSWLFKFVFKNPDEFRYNRRLIYAGGLFMFEYKNPKYKGTVHLPWFDKYPLVISLGPVVTKLGVRNLGFNLHLLPPKIRIIAICAVFELYKKLYRYQIFFKQEKPVQIHYKQIVRALDMYGIKFSIRMYIPSRMNQIVFFPIKTWYKAIFIPSRGYDGIRAMKLIQAWKAYCRKNQHSASENINWKAII
jgi:hypothetical protein